MSISRLTFILLFALGCGGSQKADPIEREAFPTELRVAKNVATANRGQTDAALAYARAYIDAHKDGYWTRNPGEANLTYDVTTKLDLALKEHPEDVAVIGTQRGNLFLAIGEPKKGRAALVDVLEKTPHLEAAKQLLVSYPRTQKKETGFICRAVTDTFEWGDPKFEFMQTCVNWSGAETAQAGLVWAHETDQRWFLARRSNQTVVQRQIETEPSKRSAPGWSTDLKRLLDLNE